ncbi:MAG: helix-turn-helix transcriptional regulator [Lachnospiraceae bacterium]|nr:helix-turn-helix transcriptional regulator [Lachnospiraceae bacterium]
MIKNENTMDPYNFRHNCGKLYYEDHWHQNVEIIMPIAESIVVEMNTDVFCLKENDILIVPSNTLHMLKSDSERGQQIILKFDLQILNSIKGLANTSLTYSRQQLITEKNAPVLQQNVKKILLDMLSEYLNKDPYHDISIICKILEITILLSRDERIKSSVIPEMLIPSKEHIAKFNECIKFIRSNCKDNISLEMAAESIGFSKYHFARWFKQCAGISFTDFLARVRIEKAKVMLISTDNPVTEIAFESGFQSIATFNRVFKDYTGNSPKKYRKNITDTPLNLPV